FCGLESRTIEMVSVCDVATNTLSYQASISEMKVLVRQVRGSKCNLKPTELTLRLRSRCGS
ncbi:MAG: hypothetical protein AB7F86_17235, partial [Bdellovibrionales bacterium]